MDRNMATAALTFVVFTAAFYTYSYLEGKSSRSEVESRIREVYELANPGASVSDFSLIDEGGVYRAVFRLDGQLVEVHADKQGLYLFPVSTDLKETLSEMKSQTRFFSCLKGQGVILYGQSDTNTTLRQFRELDNSMFIGGIYYDCTGGQLQTCLSRNVTSVPAWFINGTLYEGIATPGDLQRLTGCAYE